MQKSRKESEASQIAIKVSQSLDEEAVNRNNSSLRIANTSAHLSRNSKAGRPVTLSASVLAGQGLPNLSHNSQALTVNSNGVTENITAEMQDSVHSLTIANKGYLDWKRENLVA